MNSSDPPSSPDQLEPESEEERKTKHRRFVSIIFKSPVYTPSEGRFEGEICQQGHQQKPIEDKDRRFRGIWGTFLVSFLAGGVAGAAGKIITSPIENVKDSLNFSARVQKRVLTFRNAYENVFKSYVSDDVRSIIYGQRGSVVRGVPYTAFLFTSHEMWKKCLHVGARSTRLKRMSAGSLAGVTAVTITYPLDLYRSRMTARFHEDYSNLGTGLRRLWEEGRYGMFRGYIPTVIGIIPYCGVKFYLYDNMKYGFYERRGRRPGFVLNGIYGTIAGIFGQTLAYPFEVVRRRMQLTLPDDTKYRTISGTLATIFREEGIRGYFTGLTINWLGPPLAIGFTFAVFEVVRDFMLGHSVYRHYFQD